MTLHLYTRHLFLKERLKARVKQVLAYPPDGPQAVASSLVRGLGELSIPFVVNAKPAVPATVACVLSNAATLKWAIEQKRKGLFSHIVSGPNVVVVPPDHNGLVKNPLIDSILVPSVWNKSWWVSLEPTIRQKTHVWAAGVEDHGSLRDNNGSFLVFKKHVPEAVYQGVLAKLKQQAAPFQTIEYGTYTPEEYRAKLKISKAIIYFNELESQGLALHEAWMANVPTLVWNPGVLHYKQYAWADDHITAPYLTDACGMFFKDEHEFGPAFQAFQNKYYNFTPRAYSLEHFSDIKSAQAYLSIIKQLHA